MKDVYKDSALNNKIQIIIVQINLLLPHFEFQNLQKCNHCLKIELLNIVFPASLESLLSCLSAVGARIIYV